MDNLNKNQIRLIKEALSSLPNGCHPTLQDKMDLINLRRSLNEAQKDISNQLLKAYHVLDDVRAKLENIGDDIVINELDDEHHSNLSEGIQDWLGDIHALDENIKEFLNEEVEL